MENNGKRRLPQWFTAPVMIQIAVWIFMMAFYVSNVAAHVSNENVHMSYQAKVKEFVPRQEFELLKDQLDRIEAHTKSLEEYVRNN